MTIRQLCLCRIIFGMLFLFASVPIKSQSLLKHFTTENGLPSNGIKGLQWDTATKFLWVATEAGLTRFNGMHFKTFDINSNPEFGSNRIVFLTKNTAGHILVSGEEGNLSRVSEQSVSPLFSSEGLAKQNYNHFIAVEASDRIFKKCFKDPWPSIFSLHNTRVLPIDDTSCLALCEGKLYQYSLSLASPQWIPLPLSKIKFIGKLGGQIILQDEFNMLYIFLSPSQKIQKINQLNTLNAAPLHLDQNSYLIWKSGMSEPVLLQNGNAWLMKRILGSSILLIPIAEGIPEHTEFKYVQYDPTTQSLFLGSGSKGLYILHKRQLESIQPIFSATNQINAFYSQIELPNGNILTNQGDIIGKVNDQDQYNIGSNFYNNVYQLEDSLLIFGKKDSTYFYNPHTKEKTGITMPFSVTSHLFAQIGPELYFVNSKGIGIVSKRKTFTYLKKFDSLSPIQLNPADLLHIGSGKLAIATCMGLLQFDIRNHKLDTLLHLKNTCIRTLHQEGKYLFMGTFGGGFYMMKSGIVKKMPIDVNGYLNHAHCFIKDKNSFLWISTNRGLFKAKLEDLIRAFENSNKQVYYHYFGKDDGMLTTEFNGGCTPCAIRLKNQNFSFPTMDGLLWFNPEEVHVNEPDGDIYLDAVLIDGEAQPKLNEEGFNIPIGKSNIDLIYVINAWCNKENLFIDYQINQGPWMPADLTSTELKVSLARLPYGENTVRIRKLNGFGINQYSYKSLLLLVATPYFQQWWFKVLAFLLLGGLVYLAIRIRLYRYQVNENRLSAMVKQKTKNLEEQNTELEKNNQIKTRLISVINHDIITPLKFMHYAGKALVENKQPISEEQQKQTIAEITHTAKEMEMLSSQILNWIIYQQPSQRMQKEHFNLHHLVDSVFSALKYPAAKNETVLQNSIPEPTLVFQQLEPMRVLLYNLVSNSIHFTQSGGINIELLADGQLTKILVSDNGLGMSEEQIENIRSDAQIIAKVNVDNRKGTGLGYLIIKDLLQMMEAGFHIQSKIGMGTTVTIFW